MTVVHVNGRPHTLTAPPGAALLDVLRDTLGLPGSRPGCREGACGACHVLVDGRSVAACQTPWDTLEGREVTTVEALPAALAEAFAAEQAAQCGFCSSGMLVSAAALLKAHPLPTEAQVRAALDRHLCRCGAHLRIVRAVQRAAAALQGSAAGARSSALPPLAGSATA